MSEVIVVKIWGTIYHLQNGERISIYDDMQTDIHCIEKNGIKSEIHQYEGKIGYKQDNEAPIYVEYLDQHIQIYIRDTMNIRTTYNRIKGSNNRLHCGMNRIHISKIKKDHNPRIRVQIQGCDEYLRFHFDDLDNNSSNDSDKYSKDEVNSLINPYSDVDPKRKTDKMDETRDMLHKSSNAIDISNGHSRLAFKILDSSEFDFINNSNDGCIIKVAIKQTGLEENKKEIQTWQAVKGTELEKCFCPITNKGSNDRYIIMEEAKVLENTNKSEEYFRSISEDIEDIIDQKVEVPDNYESFSNEHNDPISERRLSYNYDIFYKNVGIYNGNPVLIDYPFGARAIIKDN